MLSYRKVVLTALAIALLLLASCGKSLDQQVGESPFQGMDTPWDDRAVFRLGLIPSEQEMLHDLEGASIYHIDVHISQDYLGLSGWEEVHYTNREEIPLEEIYFQLFPNASGGRINISKVALNGQRAASETQYEHTALKVNLPSPLRPGEAIVVRLEFEVQLPQEMGGNYGLFGYFENVLVLDEFYPVIPVFDDEGWNVQVPPPNADTSYFDASFYIVRVTAPSKLTIASTGVEVARESDKDQEIITYAAGPARDFYFAASEDYVLVTDTDGETQINAYVLEGLEYGAGKALQVAKNALTSYRQRFGPYPYTEFDMMSTPMKAMGVEYPGIVGITIPAFDPEKEVGGLPFPVMLESVVAHEVAHQWFYNLLGNDQIDEPWLDEAMAQYATWLYFMDMYGRANAQGFYDSWETRWQRVDKAEIPIGLPAGDYEGKQYGAIVYGRGPIFIARLAQEMGQEAFDAFLKEYSRLNKWGIVTTDSFRELAEQQCDCDLSALFAEWVYP